MRALGTAYAQKAMSEDTALQKGIEFVFDEIGQSRFGLGLDLGEEDLSVFSYQLVEDRLIGSPPFILETSVGRKKDA